jgi:hypothetical protein
LPPSTPRRALTIYLARSIFLPPVRWLSQFADDCFHPPDDLRRLIDDFFGQSLQPFAIENIDIEWVDVNLMIALTERVGLPCRCLL